MVNQRKSLLIEPTYGYKVKPSVKEIFVEWGDAINFTNPSRTMIAFYLFFHVATFMVFLRFLTHSSVIHWIFFFLSTSFLATIYNTIWYHRYCSHQSFTFKKPFFTKFFLWTNPIVFREESYALPHQIHHRLSDKLGDPYGPHLGWLGSYLATESQQKTNLQLSEDEFDGFLKSLRHVGFVENSFENFRKTGAFEKINYYMMRVIFSQFFWVTIVSIFLGYEFITPWYASVFFVSFLMRDFNWRGHGGNFRDEKIKGWEFHKHSKALNQYFYGYLASEWHDNHHSFPHSANSAFLTPQFDLAFILIKFLSKLNFIETYYDDKDKFLKSMEKAHAVNA